MRRILLWIKYRPGLFGKYGDTPANKCWLKLWHWAVDRIDRSHA